jgi:endonuclease/exonuclease/phosphatase family metal-dependent hydrolase
MPSVRIATYNVHRAIGSDGRTDPARILAVLREIDADVYALQEVEAHDDGADMLAWLGGELGFDSVPGTTLKRSDGHFGNGLLTRCPIRERRVADLSWRGREPRGAIAIDIDCAGSVLRVVATHLGLRPAERRDQVQQLLHLFKEHPHERSVLLGDLNEWFLWGRPLRRLHRHFRGTPSLATFPARAPFLALDRIWTHPRAMLRGLAVHKTPLARGASDHLPLVATLEVGGE